MVDFAKKLADKRAKEALDKIKRQAAPNLNTGSSKAKPKPKDEPVILELDELGLSPDDLETLKELIPKQATISATQARLRKQREAVTDIIKQVCKFYGLLSFKIDGRTSSYYKTVRTSISRELLLANGVDPEAIAKSTTATEAWAFKTSSLTEEGDEIED